MYFDNKLIWTDWVVLAGILILGVFGCAWEGRLTFKYKKIKRHMTKRINVMIIGRLQMRRNYIYWFTGLDEYKGVIFHDAGLEVRTRHEKGEIVSLLINEYNLEEFWFEEASSIDHGKGAIGLGVVTFFCILLGVAIASL